MFAGTQSGFTHFNAPPRPPVTDTMDVRNLPIHFDYDDDGYDDDYAGSDAESYSNQRHNSKPDDVLQMIQQSLSPNRNNSTRLKETMDISPVRLTRSATKARRSLPMNQTRSPSKSRQSSSATMVSSPSPEGKGNPPIRERQYAGRSYPSSEYLNNLSFMGEERRAKPDEVQWPKNLFRQKPPTCNELKCFLKAGSTADDLKRFHSRVLVIRKKINEWCRKTVKMAIVKCAKSQHMKYKGKLVQEMKEVGKSWMTDGSDHNARKVFTACIGQFESDGNAWMREKEVECLTAFKLVPNWYPNGYGSFITSTLKRQRSLLLREVNNCAILTHGSSIRVRRTTEQTARQPIYKRERRGDPAQMNLVRNRRNVKDDASSKDESDSTEEDASSKDESNSSNKSTEDDASSKDESNNSNKSYDDDSHVADASIVGEEDTSTNHSKRGLGMEESPTSRKSHRISSSCDATTMRQLTETILSGASQSCSNVAGISKSTNADGDSRSCSTSTVASGATTQALLDTIRELKEQKRVAEAKLRTMRKYKDDMKKRNAQDAIKKRDDEEECKLQNAKKLETACRILKHMKENRKKRYAYAYLWDPHLPLLTNFLLGLPHSNASLKKQLKTKSVPAKELDSITKEKSSNEKRDANHDEDMDVDGVPEDPDEDMDVDEEPEDVHIYKIANPRWKEDDKSHKCGKKKKGKPNGCWMVSTYWDSEKYNDEQKEIPYEYTIQNVYKDRPDLVEELLKDESLDPAVRLVIEKLVKPKEKVKDKKSNNKGIKKATKGASNNNESKDDNELKVDTETKADIVMKDGNEMQGESKVDNETKDDNEMIDDNKTMDATAGVSTEGDKATMGQSTKDDIGTIVTADADKRSSPKKCSPNNNENEAKADADKRSSPRKSSPKKNENKAKAKQPTTIVTPNADKRSPKKNENNATAKQPTKKVDVVVNDSSNDSDSYVTADNEIIPTVRV